MKKIIVTFVAVALLSENVHALSLAKRDTETGVNETCSRIDDNVIVQLSNVIGALMNNIPMIGGFVEPWFILVGNFAIAMQDVANGAIGMIFSGAVPCIISEENGFVCTGVAAEDGYVAAVTKLIFLIPGFMIPGIYKDVTEYLLKLLLQPILVFIFGGVFVYPEIK